MYEQYRNSPVASTNLADSLAGLAEEHRLTPDVQCAAHLAPLRFHPRRDHVFYVSPYGDGLIGLQQEIAASKTVHQKFYSWYSHSSPLERAYLCVAALTASYENFDKIVDDAMLALKMRHRLEMVAPDDEFFYTDDFMAMREPENIRTVLDTPAINYWIEIFRQQVHRVVNTPIVDLDDFLRWQGNYNECYWQASNALRHCVFAKNGYTLRQGRRIIKRSYRLLANLVGERQVRGFVAGREMIIVGQQFLWGLTMQPRTLSEYTINPPRNHCPYRMKIYDHHGHELAECCVLFRNTPVLDQAAGIVLSVCNIEEEFSLLRDCNIFRHTEDGLDCALLRPPFRVAQTADRVAATEEWVIDVRDEILPEVHEVAASPLPYDDPTIDDGYDAPLWLPGYEVSEDDAIIFDRRVGPTNRFFRDIYEEDRRLRATRYQHPVAQRLRDHLFARIGGPPDLLNYMVQPEVHGGWIERPHHHTLPERIARYITTKTFD